jgi:NADH-quinone oxidoreductase subunit L
MVNNVVVDPALIGLTLAVILSPLLSALICFFVRGNRWFVPVIACLIIGMAGIGSGVLMLRIFPSVAVSTIPWFSAGADTIQAGLLLNPYSTVMLSVVLIISAVVHVYSIGYLAGDPHTHRYFSWLGFFTFAMIGFVLSSNLLMTFCFWELIGLSSYRLIGHWQEKKVAAMAATKAFMVNRVGDLGFLLALMMLWSHAGTLNIQELSQISLPSAIQTIVGLCLLLAVTGKSAQFPLFHWLPDAMAGPTPVSALIHAATLVAAGVFLLIQLSFLFSPMALMVTSVIGWLTLLIGAWGAFTQFDLKRILAYSTISQLGLMVAAVGMGNQTGAFFHLMTHAFFKAGLFLMAGILIHQFSQPGSEPVQDIRHLGGWTNQNRLLALCLLILGASLMGVPLTSGFLSKELMLSHAWENASGYFEWVQVIILMAGSVLTAAYTFRMLFYILSPSPTQLVHKAPVIMFLPVILLTFLSLFIVVSNSPGSISGWAGAFEPVAPGLSTLFISVATVITGIVFSWFLYKEKPAADFSPRQVPQFFPDWIQQRIFVKFTWAMAEGSRQLDLKWIDGMLHTLTYVYVTFSFVVGWIDRTLVDGSVGFATRIAAGVGRLFRGLMNGKIQSYIAWGLLAILSLMVWILY